MAIELLKVKKGKQAPEAVTKIQSTVTLPDELAMVLEGYRIRKGKQRSDMISELIVEALENLPDPERQKARETFEQMKSK